MYNKNCLNVSSRLFYKFSFIIIIILVAVLFYGSINGYYYDSRFTMRTNPISNQIIDIEERALNVHRLIIQNYYDKRKNWTTSNLGSILFKNIDRDIFTHTSRQNKTYVILIWKHFDWLKKRHIFHFDDDRKSVNPLEDCPVRNCKLTGNDSLIFDVDAVVIHIQRGIYPKVKKRNPDQRWIFLSDESPKHTFINGYRKPTIREMANVFNWTMTYRSDSDIPVPYGRTEPLSIPYYTNIYYNEEQMLESLIPYWSNKQSKVLVSILVSDCTKHRMEFLRKLQRHLWVDVYGKCSTNSKFKNKCPGHFKSDCAVIAQYKFYLVFENANCIQYLSEKIFQHAYNKGAIPIIIGPTVTDCEKLLPPESFIHISKFNSLFDLARYMQMLSANYVDLMSYHTWRNHFRVVNEHGYFKSKSVHYCRICEALNYNDGEKSIYDEDDLSLFLNPNITCTTDRIALAMKEFLSL